MILCVWKGSPNAREVLIWVDKENEVFFPLSCLEHPKFERPRGSELAHLFPSTVSQSCICFFNHADQGGKYLKSFQQLVGRRHAILNGRDLLS